MEPWAADILKSMLPNCVDNLWKKESDDSSALYANLFEESKITLIYGEFSANRSEGKNNVIADKHRADGNQLFGEKKWLEALNKYNESLRYAEYGSESVGLAYANRASCYSHLGEYDSCLADIELAIKSNYPERLMPKLQQKKADSMAKQDQRNVFKPKLELSYPPNASIPCMSNVLEIRQNDEYGRHIVAKCDIPPGKIIFIEPHLLAFTTNRKQAMCATCQRPRSNLMPCESCTVAMFCSAECVKRSRAYHSIECGYIFDEAGDTPMPQKLIRSIFIAINACGSADALMEFVERVRKEPKGIPTSTIDPLDQFRTFLQLHIGNKKRSMGHATISMRAYRFIMTMPEMIRPGMFDTLAKRRFLMHWIVLLGLIGEDNSFDAADMRGQRGEHILQTMSLIVSLFNHQCTSNAVQRNVAGNVVVSTIRPVKYGQQVFISYLLGDQLNRRQSIFDTFGFWCGCSKCVPIAMPPSAIISMENDSDWLAIQLLLLSKDYHSGDIDTLTKVKEHCISYLSKYGHLPHCHDMEIVMQQLHDCIVPDG